MNGIVTQIHPGVHILFSTESDGSMSSGGGAPSKPEHAANVERFLQANDFPVERTRVYVTYGDDRTYTDVVRVTSINVGGNIRADALYTTEPDYTITLPVADCVATVVYDPVAGMMGVLHLGRHSSVEGLIESFVIDVADTVGSDPRDWYVWMSPSIRQDHDRLDYFTPPNADNWRDYMRAGDDDKIHIDTVGHNTSRFVRAGVDPDRIVVSPISTYDDPRLYSHRAYAHTADPTRQGRMLVAARMMA